MECCYTLYILQCCFKDLIVCPRVCMTPDVAVHHPRGVSRSELPERRRDRHHPPALPASGQLPWRL